MTGTSKRKWNVVLLGLWALALGLILAVFIGSAILIMDSGDEDQPVVHDGPLPTAPEFSPTGR